MMQAIAGPRSCDVVRRKRKGAPAAAVARPRTAANLRLSL